MSDSVVRVGFLGLGTMGRPMARNLARKGFPLTLQTRSSGKAEAVAAELRAEGFAAAAAGSAAAVAAVSDVVVSCVPDAPEVEAAHLGPSGTIEGARPGTLVIDCSTIAPEAAVSVAARLAAAGLGFLDSPVSGGQKGAVEGTLTFFVGGPAEDVARAQPVFAAMGRRVTHLGGAGAGQLGKAVNQVIVAGNLLALAEGMALAAKSGLPLGALREALLSGAASSWALDVLGRKMIDRDFAPAFAVKHQQKDLAIVLRAARERGLPLPGVALVHQLLAALEARGRADDGTQALLTVYESLGAAAPTRPEGPPETASG